MKLWQVHHYSIQLGTNGTIGSNELLEQRGAKLGVHSTWNLNLHLPQQLLDSALRMVFEVRGRPMVFQAAKRQQRNVFWASDAIKMNVCHDLCRFANGSLVATPWKLPSLAIGASFGICGATTYGNWDQDPQGSCRRSNQGAWSASSHGIKTLGACAAKCRSLKCCHAVSFSLPFDDCSWFKSCPYVTLPPRGIKPPSTTGKRFWNDQMLDHAFQSINVSRRTIPDVTRLMGRRSTS